MARTDVLRLMSEKGLKPAPEVPKPRDEQECKRCKALAKENQELHLQLAQAQRMVNAIFPS